LCPVGAVWKKHFDETKDYSYYGPDLFHPSQKGSEIAAKVIVDALFK
jgi:lysophospholipase L1-like esterase